MTLAHCGLTQCVDTLTLMLCLNKETNPASDDAGSSGLKSLPGRSLRALRHSSASS